jgi:very-short-patch-repair endonuclease
MKNKHIHTNKIFYTRRKELRNNLTHQEIILWIQLKNKNMGYKFQRQHSIGPYIVDFYCAQKKLIIELDGSQHLDKEEYDRERTLFLQSLGFKVLRFWNSEVDENLDEALGEIRQFLNL